VEVADGNDLVDAREDAGNFSLARSDDQKRESDSPEEEQISSPARKTKDFSGHYPVQLWQPNVRP